MTYVYLKSFVLFVSLLAFQMTLCWFAGGPGVCRAQEAQEAAEAPWTDQGQLCKVANTVTLQQSLLSMSVQCLEFLQCITTHAW